MQHRQSKWLLSCSAVKVQLVLYAMLYLKQITKDCLQLHEKILVHAERVASCTVTNTTQQPSSSQQPQPLLEIKVHPYPSSQQPSSQQPHHSSLSHHHSSLSLCVPIHILTGNAVYVYIYICMMWLGLYAYIYLHILTHAHRMLLKMLNTNTSILQCCCTV